jgi:catalase
MTVKISGSGPRHHPRDLWDRIEAGAFPEWEFGVQVFPRGASREPSTSTC